MVEKLSKALEGLKSIQFTSAIEDASLRKKEKMLLCALVADLMVSLRFTNAQNVPQLLGIVVESFIHLCDDKDSDVRMVADESLNRIIRASTEVNIMKVQEELLKEIKKNGPPRCLRAALWRFGLLSSYIRPNKGKGLIENLVPCVVEISKRNEESVHETLATFIENTFKVIGVFLQDNEIKILLKAFFHNLSSVNAVIRRTTAASINSTVKHVRKPHVFNSYVLNILLDKLVPVKEENSPFLILGVLGCLRVILPNLCCDRNDEGISGTFGLRHKKDESLISVDRLVQTYELCLYYSKSEDNNIVTASLETLNQLLQNPPQQLHTLLLSPTGFSRSYIHSTKENKIRSRSGSEASVLCALGKRELSGDENSLFDDNETLCFDMQGLLVNPNLDASKESPPLTRTRLESTEDEIKIVENPLKEKLLDEIFEDQLNIEIDSDAESWAPSDINASSLLMRTEISGDALTKDLSRTNSRDDLHSIVDGESLGREMNINVGSFTDRDVSLIFCARHLAASFLLEGTKSALVSDRIVRVSVKSLALSCLSAIVKLHPTILNIDLAKTHNQEMRDLILFAHHPDPQIRGCISILVSCYINSVLMGSKSFEAGGTIAQDNYSDINNLLDVVFEGLKDESSTCSRQALSGLKHCLKSILFSSHTEKLTSLLCHLPLLGNSSYWLQKVKLVEVLSELPFVCLTDLTSLNSYQEEVIDRVFFPLLGDEDSRVRTATAESLGKVIPRLYYGKSSLIVFSSEFTARIKNCLTCRTQDKSNNYLNPFSPFSYIYQNESNFDLNVENSLSRIVAKLTNALMTDVTKHFTLGCLEALKLLSEKYPPTVYQNGWNCSKVQATNDEDTFITSSLVTVILSLLLTSPYILDLSALNNTTVLLGNLFAGHAICNLKFNYQVSLSSPVLKPLTYWNVLRSQQLSVLAEHIFTHILRVLNIYSNLLEEVPLSKASAPSTAPTNLLPISLASPIKKQEKKVEKEDKSEERKIKSTSSYKQSPHYVKLYDFLKSAYNNYKVSLDSAISEKFLGLLESTINVLCILLEIGNAHDVGRCAEEILSYLRPAVSLCASPSVQCAIQLLKSLFGTNLGANWEGKKPEESDHFSCSLFANIYQIPSELLSSRIADHSISTTLEYENLTGSRRRTDRKIVVQNIDKNSLATYIRLFKPIMMKSLQLYTITNDVTLQSNILQLLNQLIQQLRVNYCWLDTDEIFVGFVLRQFELIERGQILGVEKLLPQIFKFLVSLSYGKHHSKAIMSIPQILQLCDGLMASNQCTQTHCIPALVPIVEDVFLSRNLLTPAEQKELETQREVVLAKLLCLVEFHEVMNMLTLILNESRTLEEKERWKRWSRQVMDKILPLASQDKLRTETFEGQESFNKLMSSLSPNVLRPIDPLLKILFVEPADYNCSLSLKRWLSRVTVITETILHVKEDVLLCRLEEIFPNINLSSFFPPENMQIGDPFNVQSSFPKFGASETFARFLLKIVSITGYKILESASTSYHFQMQLSIFFLCVFQILKSGTFHRVTASLQTLLTVEKDAVLSICSMYVKIMNFAPVLSCQFTYFLALLNYFDINYWTTILHEKNTLPSKLVQSCGVICISDYLCEIMSDNDILQFLLSKSMKEVILLSDEIPIKELITTVHRRPESSLLMEAIKSQANVTNDPRFVEKLLRILEIAHSSHSGFILSLLIKSFIISPYLALSRLASLLACRRAEFLLTLSSEEVHSHLGQDQFHDLINFVNNEKLIKRHFRLIGLLNKLNTEVYNLQSIEMYPAQVIDTQRLKMLQLDEDWYSTQIKERCSKKKYSGQEIAKLLSKLNYDRIVEVMSCPSFNSDIPRDCLLFLSIARKKKALHSPCEVEESFVNDPLFRASKSFILNSIHKIIEELELIKSSENHSDEIFPKAIIDNSVLYTKIGKLAPSLTTLLEIIHTEKSNIEKEFINSVMEFGLTWLEIICWLVKQKKMTCHTNQENIVGGLLCCNNVLRNGQVSNLISQSFKRNRLKSCIQNVHALVKYLIPQSRLTDIIYQELCNKQYAYNELLMVEYLLALVMREPYEFLLPSYLKRIIRALVINTCRIPEISIHVLKVPENSDLQEVENVESFISVFSAINWSSRQQFEEIWMGLLSVLGFNSRSSYSVEEHVLVVQASTAAVEGITALLKNTMINPFTKKILHHGRDSSMMGNIDKVPLLTNLDANDHFGDVSYHYTDNIEISKITNKYHHGLLSVEYIWTAVKQIKNRIELYENHTKFINDIGLDLTSCVHLLMELYNLWIFQSTPDIRLITSCLKSSIVISDLFTDIAQFQWLLDFCLRIEEIIIAENVVILPLVILGACKAVSVVLPDIEICERLKRLMLHSRSIPNRIATIQGLLYLLQSPEVISAASHSQRYRTVSLTDESSLASNLVDIFLPVAIEMIQHFKYQNFQTNEEYERCSWSLLFYLLQHYHQHLKESRGELMNFILVELSKRTCSEPVMALLVRGIERLLLTSVIEETFKDQISKIALDMISQSSIKVSRCGLQLLMVLSFLEKRAKDIRFLVTGREDPEKIMKDMEKINILFEKLKKSYPEEAEIIGDVIAYILMDFTASDVLTKVIQEFLSSHQPHLKILSGLLFKVFERAELSLLEDWVVFSLSSFIQDLPVSMSVWTLNCFFVSASKESWLRFMFPLVQSRLRMAEVEDKELLCLSASYFYKQLKDEKQKKLFVETFQNAAKTDDVFSDLLASL